MRPALLVGVALLLVGTPGVGAQPAPARDSLEVATRCDRPGADVVRLPCLVAVTRIAQESVYTFHRETVDRLRASHRNTEVERVLVDAREWVGGTHRACNARAGLQTTPDAQAEVRARCLLGAYRRRLTALRSPFPR